MYLCGQADAVLPFPSRMSEITRWRLLSTDAADGPANMALDEALMQRAAATGEWILRVYAWSAPTLSLGRNQRALEAYDPATLESHGVPVVRRPTGGRALLHDREVTYSVVAPLAAAGPLRLAYGRINRLLLHALHSLGVDAAIVGAAQPYRVQPGAAPCFDHPAPGEIVVGGRKLVGSAQWRDEEALLQHGSILLDGDQAPVSALMRRPVPPPPAPATLRDLAGEGMTWERVRDALFDAVRALEDPRAASLPLDPRLLARAAALADRYAAPAWTWRR